MKGTLAVTNDPKPTSCSTPIRWPSCSACCSTSRCRWSGRSTVPTSLKERLGGTLDAAAIAAMGPEKVDEILQGQAGAAPVPGLDGQAGHALCQHLVEHYGGRAEAHLVRRRRRATSS